MHDFIKIVFDIFSWARFTHMGMRLTILQFFCFCPEFPLINFLHSYGESNLLVDVSVRCRARFRIIIFTNVNFRGYGKCTRSGLNLVSRGVAVLIAC